MLVPSQSWKHHTGKNKTGLGSSQGTAKRCLFSSSRFLLRQSQEEQVPLSAWCLQRCSRRVLPLSRSQTPECHDLKTCAILVHPACSRPPPHALFSLITNCCPLFSRPPFPVTLTTLIPVEFVSFKERIKKTPQYLQAFCLAPTAFPEDTCARQDKFSVLS